MNNNGHERIAYTEQLANGPPANHNDAHLIEPSVTEKQNGLYLDDMISSQRDSCAIDNVMPPLVINVLSAISEQLRLASSALASAISTSICAKVRS
jgi:hypothetical protein